MEYRCLTEADIPALHRTHNLAFSDYSVNLQMPEEVMRRNWLHNGVRFDLSMGAWADGELAGFILNGIGDWQGRLTAYDAGTGVVPAHRGRGVAGDLFRAAVPLLKAAGVTQYLLEVIRSNAPALKVYRGLGMRETRALDCLRCPPERRLAAESVPAPAQVREIETPDWDSLRAFWDVEPSWQNSIAALERRAGPRTMLGAFRDERCAGYLVVGPGGGIPQFAVSRAWRRRGIGRQLLAAAWECVPPDRSLTMINVDAGASDTLAFLVAHGFESFTGQYEMLMNL
jgi:ribosomal protein S18 acetylase RimI-like enzyme